MAVTARQLVLARRTCQAISVIFLIYIIWSTRYPLSGFINPKIYFYLDPFAMIITSIAERVLIPGLISAAIVLVITLVIGRAFCGWICPLGALLDLVSWTGTAVRRLFRKKQREGEPSRFRFGKYAVLLAVFTLALFGVQTAWILDPITIFVRAFSFNVHPFLNGVIDGGMTRALNAADYPEWLESLYDWLRQWLLSLSTPEFSHSGIILGVLAAILLFSLYRRRFWCRYLCPLGAILALPARFSSLSRKTEECRHVCGTCQNTCRMNAIRDNNTYIKEECILCMDCMAECPGDKTRFSFTLPGVRVNPQGPERDCGCQRKLGAIVIASIQGSELNTGCQSNNSGIRATCLGSEQIKGDSYRLHPGVRATSRSGQTLFSGKKPVLTRSQFITSALGAIVIAFGPIRAVAGPRPPRSGTASRLRPPGALPEKEFIQRCIRCGNCMKVCPTNLLQPSSLAAGIGGAWSPVLDTRRGYCEYGCNLCGRVCPTDAIRELTVRQKQMFKIGTAVFDKTTCLPYAKGENCIVCEEHCPVPEKAIRVKKARVNGKSVMQPYVVKDLCIGCAICELKCPTAPDKGIIVVRTSDAVQAPRDPGVRPVS